ncbi:MAG: hypothetical protein WDZ32_01700 [Candidatus Saccharimonadales bacterium]
MQDNALQTSAIDARDDYYLDKYVTITQKIIGRKVSQNMDISALQKEDELQ